MMAIEVENTLPAEDHPQVTTHHLVEELHLHRDVVPHLVLGGDLLMKFLLKLNRREETGMEILSLFCFNIHFSFKLFTGRDMRESLLREKDVTMMRIMRAMELKLKK